jgi:filamentous hemagglutinin family protein
LNTTIRSGGPTTFIDGGTRPGTGSARPNLFHSFGNFSIGTGETALFRNLNASGAAGSGYTGTTNNISGRVTGGNVSNIFGTIDSATHFPEANFWLINPAGVLFGPNARINVGGSINIATADYLRLSDGVLFSATPGSADALLTIAPPAAFGFLRPNAGITIQGAGDSAPLLPSSRVDVSLVGGDISVTERTINANGGHTTLTSLASAGR